MGILAVVIKSELLESGNSEDADDPADHGTDPATGAAAQWTEPVSNRRHSRNPVQEKFAGFILRGQVRDLLEGLG